MVADRELREPSSPSYSWVLRGRLVKPGESGIGRPVALSYAWDEKLDFRSFLTDTVTSGILLHPGHTPGKGGPLC